MKKLFYGLGAVAAVVTPVVAVVSCGSTTTNASLSAISTDPKNPDRLVIDTSKIDHNSSEAQQKEFANKVLEWMNARAGKSVTISVEGKDQTVPVPAGGFTLDMLSGILGASSSQQPSGQTNTQSSRWQDEIVKLTFVRVSATSTSAVAVDSLKISDLSGMPTLPANVTLTSITNTVADASGDVSVTLTFTNSTDSSTATRAIHNVHVTVTP